jgi:DNA polymerase-3 subunit gamma/tau
MVTQTLGEVPAELRITAEQDERLGEQARRVSPAVVVRLLELIAAALRAMKDGADARTQLELALLKAATPAYDPSVKALLARLERLEGRPIAAPPQPPVLPHSPAQPATPAARTAAASGPAAPDGHPAAETGRTAAAADPARPSGRASVAVTAHVEGEPPVAAVAVVEPESPATPSAESLAEVWPAVLQRLEEQAPDLAAVLQSARPARVGDGELTLAWPESLGFYLRKVEDPVNKDRILGVIRAVTGSSLRLAYEVAAVDSSPRISEDELVNRFVEEFDAEVLPADEEST